MDLERKVNRRVFGKQVLRFGYDVGLVMIGVAAGITLERQRQALLTGAGYETEVEKDQPDPRDLALFPLGQSLDRSFIVDQERFDMVKDASREFVKISGFDKGDLLDPIRLIDLDTDQSPVLEKIRCSKIRLAAARQTRLGVSLDFQNDVFPTRELDEQKIEVPAFIVVTEELQASELSVLPSKFYKFDTNRNSSIFRLYVLFDCEFNQISGRDFVMVLNRGLFKHQSDNATIIPVRFNVTFLNPDDRSV